MKCPVDETVLQMTDRQGIEIDYCPQCRGVWLDRGELDKLIDRSVPDLPSAAPRQEPTRSYPARSGYDDRTRRDPYQQKRKRKDSFLGELFDF